MSWSWFILLLVTYPWLLAADLLSDTLAPTGLMIFLSGAVIIAPCRRLRRWQAVLFAASVGFLFEARRPIPDGALALSLVTAAVFLTSNRKLLRNPPLALRAACACNALAAAVWFAAAAFAATRTNPTTWPVFLWQLLLQCGLAGLLGLLAYVPVSFVQNRLMDKSGVTPAADAS